MQFALSYTLAIAAILLVSQVEGTPGRSKRCISGLVPGTDCIRRCNIDYPGGDYHFLSATTLHRCISACRKDKRCIAAAFDRKLDLCFLKDQIVPAQHDKFVDSYVCKRGDKKPATTTKSTIKPTILSSTKKSTTILYTSIKQTSSAGRSTTMTSTRASTQSTSTTSTAAKTTTTTTTTTTSTPSPSTTTTTTLAITTTTSMTTPPTTTTVATSTTATSSTASSTISSGSAVVTDLSYVDTVLRHHNVHRANHSASALVWSSSLADTAKTIATSCIYGHNTTADGGGYGQNIGAGYPSTMMGAFITEGIYNSEINSYTYYGGEPDLSTVGYWGHVTQVLWKATTSIGCYTADCSSTGLTNAPGIPPYYTVCNYQPAGNVVGTFSTNVGSPLGAASISGTYECGSETNCVGPTT